MPWQDLEPQITGWDALAQCAAEPNPFLESWYQLPSLRAFDPQGDVHILRFTQDDVLRGLLPVHRPRRYYGRPVPHIAAWRHANSFLGQPLVAQGCEVHFWHALLGWADANAGSALFLHMPETGLDGPVHAALEAVAQAHDRPWGVVERGERAVLATGLSAEAYRQSVFSKQKRKDLRRRLNRLSEIGAVRFEWRSDCADLGEWSRQFLALEASGWKGEAGSALAQSPATRALFRESLAGAAHRGRLLRLAMFLDERPIAMLSTFLASPGAFGYKTSFDERHARHAPGILLENEFLSALDHGRFEWCDSCAAPDHPVMNAIWRERRTVGKISIAIGGRVRRGIFNQLLRIETGRRAAGEHA